MRTIVALLLMTYAATVAAHTYLQRFKGSSAMGAAQRLAARYAWLNDLEQPTAVLKSEDLLYRFADNLRMKGLPYQFYSHEHTVLTYANGKEVKHLLVADYNLEYEQFRRRFARGSVPAIVSISDADGTVRGTYFYSERTINYIHDVFSVSGFNFENFIGDIEPPVLNVASGGFYVARQLHRLNARLQESATHRALQVFSLDISGAHRTFTEHPWYLFGDLYATGLPDDIFGAVISFGGPLNRKLSPRHERVAALRELARITKPQGRMLIEHRIPALAMINGLREAGVDYEDWYVYDATYRSLSSNPIRAHIMEIVLGDKDYAAP